MMPLEDLGVIGNCQLSALVRTDGAIVWSCLPRFDSEPVLGELLDSDGGTFAIGAADGSRGAQRYVGNTNILETRFETEDGVFRVIDFAPRFMLFDRIFRPTKLIRIVEPIRGCPKITARCSPRLGWSKEVPRREVGSHHISYLGFDAELRLTTDAPLTYVDTGQPFALTSRRHFVLSWGAPVEEPLAPLCDRFLSQTERYWEQWVKHCDVPPLFQNAVIRSALALKLHCFEDTGAIVAAMTTSIPEAKGSGRTWDYRYCWLRDAYYALGAFRLLGHFEERERFTEFLLNVASSTRDLELAPMYRIDGRHELPERVEPAWRGYEGEVPVRVGNGAMHHRQHDVFGEMVLALSPVFLDARFQKDQTGAALDLLVGLARKAIAVAGRPDASIWELRTEWTPQTFSGVMCWVAADRVQRVAARHRPEVADELEAGARRIHHDVLAGAWSERLGALASAYGGHDLDASLLQIATLRFLPVGDPRLRATIDAIRKGLDEDGWLRRYRNDDGFGQTTVAFIICTFWLVEALAAMGDAEQARSVLQHAMSALSPTGLLAEDWDPKGRRLWGNFPQAYSHVGLIHAAFAASPSWTEVL